MKGTIDNLILENFKNITLKVIGFRNIHNEMGLLTSLKQTPVLIPF